MLNLLRIEEYDAQNMHKVYDMWPIIADEAFSSDYKKIDLERIEHIVFAGMGGSGTIGDVFSSILSKTKIHVTVVKGYVLPNTVNSNSLVVVISISGNTSETLSVLESAKNKGCRIIAMSSGGKMGDYCKKNNIEYRNITQIHSPRSSFIKFFYVLLKILQPIMPLSDKEILESIKQMKELQKNISSSNLTDNNSALKLAKWIKGIPLIYYPWGLNAAATRFKNSLQENSKIHVFMEDVIEASHNGIVAWENSSIIQPILLQGQDDNIKTEERWKIFKEYFDDNAIEFYEVLSVHGSILSKIINLIYFFDYVSIYKAVLSEIDPSPVKSINYIKEKLSNKNLL